MALKIDITTKYGIVCSYWKVAMTQKDPVSESAYIVIYGYASKVMKKYDHLEPRFINIYPKDYQSIFGIEKLSQEGMNDTKSIYEFVKENILEFKDAEFID